MNLDRIGEPRIFAPGRIEASRGKATPRMRNIHTAEIDGMDLSQETQKLSSLMALAREIPDVREHVVKAIRGRLEAGTYTIQSTVIARRLLGYDD